MSTISIPGRLGVLTIGLAAAALVVAAPALADPSTDAVVDSPGPAAPAVDDPARAEAFGDSLCPMLSQSGQDLADAGGTSLGPSGMFTGLAISAFCPGVMTALANGESPIPFGRLAASAPRGRRATNERRHPAVPGSRR